MSTVKVATPYDLYDHSQYAWWSINYFFMFWVASVGIRAILPRLPSTHSAFKSLDSEKQSKAVIYVMQILGGTVALAAQLYGGSDVIFQWDPVTLPEKMRALVFAAQIIAVLYLWELIYRRTDIGLPLLVHHLVTVLLLQLSMASSFDTHDIIYARFATLLGFAATTEQSTFVALFLWRLGFFPKWQRFWFHFSAVQSLVFKTFGSLVCMVYYCTLVHDGTFIWSVNNKWTRFWTATFLPLLLALFWSQIYACLILYRLGLRCKPRAEEKNAPIRDLDMKVPIEVQDGTQGSGADSSVTEIQDDYDEPVMEFEV